MTTIHAPAGQYAVSQFAAGAHRERSRFIAVAVAALVSVGLVGCESGNALFANASPEATLAPPAAPPPQPASLAKIAIAPIIGAPDQVARQLQQDFGSAVAQQRVSVVNTNDKSDYTLRGYIVAAKDRAGTKVSYIWDVTDPTGKRVNRITGEEVLPTAAGKDPWAAVTPPVMQSIAQKSAQSFGAWLPTATAQAPMAAAPAAAQGVGAGGAVVPAPVQTSSTGVAAVSPRPMPVSATSGQGTVSSTSLVTVVPAVVGAPGDGANSLTQAIQSELSKSGMSVTNQSASSGYRVEGVVKVGQAREGKQPIQIDWNVKDPQGKRLGTVSQKNEIPEGSLDGAWGKTADAAAAAAAQGIIKLLPQSTASN